jgi:hypothetical protein
MVGTAPFEVIKRDGDVEIRRYSAMILASVCGMSDDSSFRILFGYITGANKGKKEIPMTTPVINAPKGEKIAMTTPVVNDQGCFSFVMPSTFTLEDTPEPSDDRIVIEERRARLVGVLRFRGNVSMEDIGSKKEALIDAVQALGYDPAGEVFLMRYNGPFTPGFLRHNEVGVPLQE